MFLYAMACFYSIAIDSLFVSRFGFFVAFKKSDQSFRPLNYQWIHLIRKYIQFFFDVVFGDVSYF